MLARMIWAPTSRRSSGSSALTVALVPTGMNIGVSTEPCGVRRRPSGARADRRAPRLTSKEIEAPPVHSSRHDLARGDGQHADRQREVGTDQHHRASGSGTGGAAGDRSRRPVGLASAGRTLSPMRTGGTGTTGPAAPRVGSPPSKLSVSRIEDRIALADEQHDPDDHARKLAAQQDRDGEADRGAFEQHQPAKKAIDRENGERQATQRIADTHARQQRDLSTTNSERPRR